MSADNDHAYIISLLELLEDRKSLPPDMDPTERAQLERKFLPSVSKLRTQYQVAREKALLKAEDVKERKDFEKQQENLAKALPNITKGTLAAITAFQKNDPFTGSAAIMDICASLAPLLGGLSAAGGPPGMLVGAIFSMVGQILSFFAPKSESLTTQIQNILRNMKAEDVEQTIGGAQDKIATYSISLRKAMMEANKILEDTTRPTDEKLSESVAEKAKGISRIIKDFNPIEGTTISGLWEVARWLREEKNQPLEKWPTILAGWCQAYSDLLLTTSMLPILANPDGMRKRFDEAEGLPSEHKAELRKSLTSLRANAWARLTEIEAANRTASQHVRTLFSAAQNRGMCWQIDPSGSGYLYGGTDLRRGAFRYLEAQCKRIAVAASEKDLGTPTPTYHIFPLEPSRDGRTYHGLSKHPYDKPPAWKDLGPSVRGLTDIWATYGGGSNANEIYFHGTKGKSIVGYILDESGKVRPGNYSPVLKSNAISVRVVRNPSWIVDDPDAGPEGARLQREAYITYGGCEASPDIFVDALGVGAGYVPSPWTEYRGLGVDDHYLWVFGSGGFACATHASVMRCRKKEIDRPRWMEHYPNDLLYSEKYHEDQKKVTRPAPPLRGLLDLSPCDDGTLVAAIAKRSVRYQPRGRFGGVDWYFVDDAAPPLYTAVYQTNLKEQKIKVEWMKLPEGTTGVRVQKLPVACWSMLETLEESLPKFAPVAKA